MYLSRDGAFKIQDFGLWEFFANEVLFGKNLWRLCNCFSVVYNANAFILYICFWLHENIAQFSILFYQKAACVHVHLWSP